MEHRDDNETLLTVDVVAERLDVHKQTVRKWLREGQLHGVLLGRRGGYRIRESEVDRLLEEGLRPSKELAAA